MSSSLHALILGAAAGGGLPQWNCGCDNCHAAREGQSGLLPQTQSSLAVSADRNAWALLNASPDIRQQIHSNPQLQPRSLRDTPIASVLLTNGDIDHVAGLLSLREKQAFTVFATRAVVETLAANPIFNALDPEMVGFTAIELEQAVEIAPGLTARLFAVPGKVPLYMEQGKVETDLEGEQTVGVEITAGDKKVFYIPGCARMTAALAGRLRNADLVFFDGTVFTDDEMIATGTGKKTGRRMGHMAMSGEEGSLNTFGSLGVRKKVFVHINNTNPVWRPGSPERGAVEEAGWTVGADGMEISA
ncbi:pyrroloquinoline quinone biosynthesis protein PqqB [Oricola cellulosilytica]|uniref:Coenzyme PQQ synthesis protein B n=1 Tax=Oricola cellulosilytica TaxID=1429082 RepID=A0A4R0P8L3_9HYPH|nr:pyrroloquinoline quinone biosynthesis protein PqqB [Oricola cellulosilytica]TCD13402.1 pyrroloquinoline quinone biosynthesis protein PqqB [Oricola cellulosilytica]